MQHNKTSPLTNMKIPAVAAVVFSSLSLMGCFGIPEGCVQTGGGIGRVVCPSAQIDSNEIGRDASQFANLDARKESS